VVSETTNPDTSPTINVPKMTRIGGELVIPLFSTVIQIALGNCSLNDHPEDFRGAGSMLLGVLRSAIFLTPSANSVL
jgi:hypothetical protein